MVKAEDLWALEEERVEREAALLYKSPSEPAAPRFLFVFHFKERKVNGRALGNWSRALTYTQDCGHRRQGFCSSSYLCLL